MGLHIEGLLSPAEYQARARDGFAGQMCVVFDVLRATSVMVTGLAHGAAGFVPVAEISEAAGLRHKFPGALLAGERDGLRITAGRSSGVDFDLGNSPGEYTNERVTGRLIISTTTNGTRALRACAAAEAVVVGSFLNLMATARWLAVARPERLVLVCAGTGNAVALEDVLCAGALCDRLQAQNADCILDDAAELAQRVYRAGAGDLLGVVSHSQNGRRLLANPDLRADVEFCVRREAFDLVALLGGDGVVRVVA